MQKTGQISGEFPNHWLYIKKKKKKERKKEEKGRKKEERITSVHTQIDVYK